MGQLADTIKELVAVYRGCRRGNPELSADEIVALMMPALGQPHRTRLAMPWRHLPGTRQLTGDTAVRAFVRDVVNTMEDPDTDG